MKIAYVCTNFNNASYTLQAIASLLHNTRHEVRVVVVDNASSQSDQDELRRHLQDMDRVELVFSKVNLGYFSGLNEGIAAVRRDYADIDWMIVGNNDLVFPADFLDLLEARKSALQFHAVVSPDILTVEGEHQNPHVISGISRARELIYDVYYSNYYLGCLVKWVAKKLGSVTDRPDEKQWRFARSIYQGHGACYLLTPRFFEQFDKLWAPTFMMYEEYFLSKQLSDRGQSVFYEPGIQVIHHWHGSLEKLPSKQRWRMAKVAHKEYRKYVKVFK